MNDSIFEVGAEGVDARRIVSEVQAAVREKMQQNLYTDARVARAERTNLAHLKDDEAFFAFYLDCLREAVFVDISDFDIIERRLRFSRALVLLKQVIWKLLKFYTYRLWSQQNQVNGLLLSAIDSMDSRYRVRMKAMEERLDRLDRDAKQK
jgi:hypothetical protein